MVYLIPVAVVLGFIVICALMTVGEPLNPTRPLMSYDQAREHARKLQKLIQCRTVSREEGREEAEFEKLRQLMQEQFPLVHQSCQKMTFGDDCWVSVLPGLDEEKHILLMARHGVAEAEGEWRHPPFSGQILDGKLWGRGTVKNKTSLYGMFAALEELLSEGFWPQCNIWLASSCDGEGISQAADFFREGKIRFEFILDGGGAVVDPPMAGMYCPKCAMVAIHETARHKLTLRTGDKQELPDGNSATPAERMAAFITEFRKEAPFVRRIDPQLEAMLRELTPYTRFSVKLMFANLWCFRKTLVKRLPRLIPWTQELLGTGCVFHDLQTQAGGSRCIAEARLHSVNARDLAADLESLGHMAEKYGIEVLPGTDSPCPTPADMTLPAYEEVAQCIRSVFPDVPVIPFVLPGQTDAGALTDLSPCVLRFAPLRLTAQQVAGVRGKDESIDITAIGACVSFYRRLLEKYTSVWEEDSNEQSEE